MSAEYMLKKCGSIIYLKISATGHFYCIQLKETY